MNPSRQALGEELAAQRRHSAERVALAATSGTDLAAERESAGWRGSWGATASLPELRKEEQQRCALEIEKEIERRSKEIEKKEMERREAESGEREPHHPEVQPPEAQSPAAERISLLQGKRRPTDPYE